MLSQFGYLFGEKPPFSFAHTVHRLWLKLDDRTNLKGEKSKASGGNYRRLYSWPWDRQTFLK